jgi:hypothetical protein
MNQVDAAAVFTLTPAEGQLVIEALAEGPFKTVFELIGRINRQANLEAGQDGCRLQWSRADQALVIGALVKLPYHRVHQLLAKLEQQASMQVGLKAVPAPAPRKRKAA